MNKEKATEKVTVRKSNKSVKSAVMLFGAVLITTSLLGGVLAKYTSNVGSATDTARAARWGLTGEEEEIDMFKVAYEGVDGASSNTVQSKTGEKVIAPGAGTGDLDATGKIINSVIIYPDFEDDATPGKLINGLDKVETAFQLQYTTTRTDTTHGPLEYLYGEYFGDWEVDSSFGWWPLRFAVYQHDGSGDFEDENYDVEIYDGINKNKLDDGVAQRQGLNNALRFAYDTTTGALTSNNRLSEVIYPNDNDEVKLQKIKRFGVKVVWEWPFDRPELNTGQYPTTPERVDGWDTQIGNKITDTTTTNTPTFKLTMGYKAIQVD